MLAQVLCSLEGENSVGSCETSLGPVAKRLRAIKKAGRGEKYLSPQDVGLVNGDFGMAVTAGPRLRTSSKLGNRS